ncbi:MAG TPA: efflux RND transporter periplasmic adaptor subunit [Stellaceae bacterium]|nr:efflux RND transporter periplasmic adaptor subunit [Stellaceae bacterium]
MTRALKAVLAVLLLVAALAILAAAADRQPLYYQDPSGKPDYSPTPKKDAAGRDYVPVYDDTTPAPASTSASPAPPAAPSGERKILYYRNPMGLPDTSPAPKKDSMGMDYIPVYADEAGETGIVKINPERIQTLGVRTEAVARRNMAHTVRAVGTVAADERRIGVVNPKFEGWIEKLYVNTTGQTVKRGDALLEVYSPDLVLAQREYLVARAALADMAHADAMTRDNAKAIAEAALSRLKNWDISADQLTRLQRSGAATRTLTLRAPIGGIVMEKQALEGLHFGAGDMLYRITDLSTVWLMADLFEQDLAQIRAGQSAKITVQAYPGRAFDGRVAFVYPTVNAQTRTSKVRIEVPNPDLLLKTDMYATVDIAAPVGDTTVLAVPDSAVLDTGTRQTILVDRGEGRFEPRAVKLGARADGYVAVLEGLHEGEKVVIGANFLIDAESNLRAALQAFTAPEGKSP